MAQPYRVVLIVSADDADSVLGCKGQLLLDGGGIAAAGDGLGRPATDALEAPKLGRRRSQGPVDVAEVFDHSTEGDRPDPVSQVQA